MHVALTDNTERKLLPLLRDAIAAAHDARIAVAFLKSSGLDLIADALHQALARHTHVEMIVGLDFHFTEARALLSRTGEIYLRFFY